MNDLMTATELADYLKVKTNYIYQLKAQGKLPYVNLGKSRCVRFSKQKIDEWLESKSYTPVR